MSVYCITGTNRGIGLEFVRQLAASPDNTIIATVRSLSVDLSALKAASSPNTHVLVCETDKEDSIRSFAAEAAKILQAAGQAKQIDYVINSAGINSHPAQGSLSLTEAALQLQVRVNILGPAKVVEHLLAAGLLAAAVRVVNLTSGLGSVAHTLGAVKTAKSAGYSVSKAGLDMLTVHQGYELREEGGLPRAVAIVIDPGWVKTAMGGEGAMIEPEVSVSGMLKVVHGLRGEDNQKFYHYTGKTLGW